jgi:hypothetical protein
VRSGALLGAVDTRDGDDDHLKQHIKASGSRCPSGVANAVLGRAHPYLLTLGEKITRACHRRAQGIHVPLAESAELCHRLIFSIMPSADPGYGAFRKVVWRGVAQLSCCYRRNTSLSSHKHTYRSGTGFLCAAALVLMEAQRTVQISMASIRCGTDVNAPQRGRRSVSCSLL